MDNIPSTLRSSSQPLTQIDFLVALARHHATWSSQLRPTPEWASYENPVTKFAPLRIATPVIFEE